MQVLIGLVLVVLATCAFSRTDVLEDEDDDTDYARNRVVQDIEDEAEEAVNENNNDEEETPEAQETSNQEDDSSAGSNTQDDKEEEEEEAEVAPKKKIAKPIKPKTKLKAKASIVDQDDDEFEYVTKSSQKKTKKPPPQQQAQQKSASASDEQQQQPQLQVPRNVPIWNRSLDSLWMEIIFLAGLLAYALNFVIGRNKITSIITRWEEATSALLNDNFAHVGDEENKTVRETTNDAIIYASGRRFCDSLTVYLEIFKYQDLLSIFNSFFLIEKTDIIQVDVANLKMPSFTLAIFPKKFEKKRIDEMSDLALLAKSYSGSKYGLNDDIVIYTDCVDVIPFIINNDLINVLNSHQGVVAMIHVSDFIYATNIVQAIKDSDDATLMKLESPDKRLTITFSLPSGTVDAAFIEVVIHLIDKIQTINISSANKAACEKRRLDVQENIQKVLKKSKLAEVASKRHDDKYEKLTPTEKAKLAELDAKRRQRKQMKRGTMLLPR